jgi:hypothetical protein
MQGQSWILGHLEWLVGAVILLPIGYLGRWLFRRWTAKCALSPSDMQTARKTSLPTAEEIEQARNLLPLFQRADMLRNYAGLKVCWPGIFVGAQVRPDAPEYAFVHFRFDGESENGALFRCHVKVADYPIIKIAKQGESRAWVQGEIAGIEDSYTTLSNPTVEFRRLT